MYRSQNRGGKGIKGIETRDGDYVKQLFVTSTHDDLMFFTNKGKVYQMKAYEIPEAGRTARGIAIVNLLSLPGNEKVTEIVSGLKILAGANFGYQQLQMDMPMNFPRPEFYNNMFEKWNLDTGVEWKKHEGAKPMVETQE